MSDTPVSEPERLLVEMKKVKLLDWLAAHPGASGSALRQGVGGPSKVLRAALAELLKAGRVIADGRRYRVP